MSDFYENMKFVFSPGVWRFLMCVILSHNLTQQICQTVRGRSKLRQCLRQGDPPGHRLAVEHL